MRTLAIALAASTALAFGAFAQSQGTSTQSQGASQSSTPQSQSTTSNSGSSSGQSGATAGSRSTDVKVRANVRTGSGRTVVRERSDGPSVVHSRSRTRHVTTVDDNRPSSVTVIKKKKYAKSKKRTRIYASAPSRSATIIEKRRHGVVVDGGVGRSRVISRDSGVKARIGVSTTTRSSTGAAVKTTTKSTTKSSTSSGGSGASTTTGSGSSGAPSTGSGSSGSTNAPSQSR